MNVIVNNLDDKVNRDIFDYIRNNLNQCEEKDLVTYLATFSSSLQLGLLILHGLALRIITDNKKLADEGACEISIIFAEKFHKELHDVVNLLYSNAPPSNELGRVIKSFIESEYSDYKEKQRQE